MTYLYHILIGLCLIVFQSVILPYFPFSDSFYDILVPFLVYLGSYRPVRESIPVALVIGFIVDSFSGGYFGVYITAYVWLVIGMRGFSTLTHLENSLLLPVVVVVGVLIENILLIIAIMIANPEFQFSGTAMGGIAAQIFWVICTGPFFLIFFARVFQFLNVEQA